MHLLCCEPPEIAYYLRCIKRLPTPSGSFTECGFTTLDPGSIGITFSHSSLIKDGFTIFGLRFAPTSFGHASHLHKANTMNNPG